MFEAFVRRALGKESLKAGVIHYLTFLVSYGLRTGFDQLFGTRMLNFLMNSKML